MNATFPIWDVSHSVAREIGLHNVIAPDEPICWIGSEQFVAPEFNEFRGAFGAGDLVSLKRHNKMGSGTAYVVGGKSKDNPGHGVLVLCKSNAGSVQYDEIIAVRELASPPISASSKLPSEAVLKVNEITSNKAIWASILNALWPFGRRQSAKHDTAQSRQRRQ
jgi:hypothetical protein